MKSININEIINKDVDGKVVMPVTKLKEILTNGGNIWDAIIEYKPATEKYGHWYKVINYVSKKTISNTKELWKHMKDTIGHINWRCKLSRGNIKDISIDSIRNQSGSVGSVIYLDGKILILEKEGQYLGYYDCDIIQMQDKTNNINYTILEDLTIKIDILKKVDTIKTEKLISTPKDLFTFIKSNFTAKRFTFTTVSKTFTPNVIFDDHDHGAFIYQCSDKGSMNFMNSLVDAGYITEPFLHNDDLIKVIDNVEKKVYVINKDLTITIEDFREQLFSVDDLAACICAGQKITLRNGLELTVKNCFMSVNLKHPGNDRFVIYSEEYSTIQSYLPIKGSNLDNDIVAVYDPFSKKKFTIHDDLTVSVAEDNPPAKEKEVTEEVIKDDLSWETYHPEVDDIIEKTSYPGAKFIITGKLYDNFIINSFDEGTPCLVRSEFLVEKYKRIALSRLYKK